jgi:antitoxin component YwqK of YwqJK toxin-antitoxin module
MKKTLTILPFLFLLSCANKTEIKNNEVVLDIKTNQDTLYVDESFYGKVYIANKNEVDSISNVNFYYNDRPIPHVKDTSKFIFTIGNDSSLSVSKKDYELKVKYRINGKIDSTTIVKTYWMSPKINHKRSEGIVKNRKREGRWKFWYDDNHLKISQITMYKNGLKNGYDSTFYMPFFDASNNLHSVKYYENDLLNGQSVEYWKNGEVQSKAIYKNNQIDGELINYNSAGEIVE